MNELDRTGEEILHGALRSYWHPVLYADELGDRPVGVTLLDEPVVVARLGGGGVRAFRDLCVHRGTPLSGEIRVSGAKNAALPILCASLLTEEVLTLTNVPALNDLRTSEMAVLFVRDEKSRATMMDNVCVASNQSPIPHP